MHKSFVKYKYKKIAFKNNPCNGQLEYDRLKNEFYITFEHNNICENNNPAIYDNVWDIQKNVYNFSNFKFFLIDFLNKNALITFSKFKKYAYKEFLKLDCQFLFYNWRNNSKLFHWALVFDNTMKNDNQLYLKDVSIKILYTPNGKKLYWK